MFYNFSELNNKDTDKLMNFQNIKYHIFPCLANANTSLSEGVMKSTWKDLIVVFRIMFQEEYAKNISVLINQYLLDKWNITECNLIEIALQNLQNSHMELKTLEAQLSELLLLSNVNDIDIKSGTTDIFVASNFSLRYGASVIMDPGKLAQIAQLIKDDFYIIPSSVHEVLCVPMHYISDREFLEGMLKDVNRTKVLPNEILEWHVYHYHRDTGEIGY